jgi:hypothetical protein
MMVSLYASQRIRERAMHQTPRFERSRCYFSRSNVLSRDERDFMVAVEEPEAPADVD